MSGLHSIFDPTLLNSTVRSITPILLAALGGLLCARVGIFNIALEGMMLVGAFFAVALSYYTGSAALGVLAAMVAGAAVALLFAVLAVNFRGNVVVLGIGLNLLASGLTLFLLRTMFGVLGVFDSPRIQGLPEYSLGPIQNVPILGPLVAGHTIVVYLTWLLVVACYVLLFRTPLGLRMRGVGEQAAAAASLGVNVVQVQYTALLLSGVLCGLAGAQLSLGNVTLFAENMSAGRGWIAVVAVMLGQANPFGVVAASVLFGFADAIGFRLQGLGMPSELTGMVPYVATLLALALTQIKRRNKLVTT